MSENSTALEQHRKLKIIIAPIIWHSWGWVGVGVFLQPCSFSVATIGVRFKYVFVFVFSCKTGHRALLGALLGGTNVDQPFLN